MPDWSIIIHGGAKTIAPYEEDSHRRAAREAVEAGASVLREGGTALNAVEAAIKLMEKGGVFNAGMGSVSRSDGSVKLDASIMDGKTLDIGAVSGLENVEHPVSVAKALLREKAIFLAGGPANDFAREKGFDFIEPDKHRARATTPCDTVGCVTLDKNGDFAAGLSTGGLQDTLPGRVGDVPLPGCGFYADNKRAALCLSGDGEYIARLMLASDILHGSKRLRPEEAISASMARLQELGGEAGCIFISREDKIAWGHNSEHFSVGYMTSDADVPAVYLSKTETK